MRASWLCGVLTLAACGGDDESNADDDGASPGEDPSQDYTIFEVEWKQDAVVLDDIAEVQDALVSLDYEAGEIVLDESFPGLGELVPGSVALIGGVGIFHVVEREATDEGELLRVETALLTDVIENGIIEWRRSFVSVAPDDKLGLGIDEDEADSVRALPQALGSYKDGTLEFSGKVGQFDTTFKLSHADPGLSMMMNAKLSSGGLTANAAVRGSIASLTNETGIEIDSGSLELLRVRFLDVQGDVEIEAGAVEISLPDVRVSVPARLTLPVPIGGIPFYVDVGGSIEWVSTLKANATARLNGRASYRGGVGVELRGTDTTPLATFERSEVMTGEAEQVGTIDAGLGVMMNFPELSVGIGVPRVANIEAAFKFKTEVITNLALRYEAAGSLPVITGNCLRTKTNFGATLTERAKLFGFETVLDETSLFAEFGEESKTGEACD